MARVTRSNQSRRTLMSSIWAISSALSTKPKTGENGPSGAVRGKLAEAAGNATCSTNFTEGTSYFQRVAGVVHEYVVEAGVGLVDAVLEGGGGVGHDHFSAVHDRDAAAERLGLFHVVRRHHEGRAVLRAQPLQVLPDRLA